MQSEIVWLVVGGGIVTLLARGRSPIAGAFPAWLVSGLAGPVDLPELVGLFGSFPLAGAVVFGSGLAIVPFLHGAVVTDHHWLTEQQFLDAVAVAMITPGPVVITVAFIGYMVGGVAGAIAAALGMFLPCFLFVVIPAPYYRRFAGKGRVKTFVDGVTAGAVGAIAGAAFVLARRAIVDPTTIAIALVTLVIFWRTKTPEPLVIGAAGLAGVMLRR